MPDQRIPASRPGALVLCALAFEALALAGCADSAVHRGQSELAALQRQLPGIYTTASGDAGERGTSSASGAINGAAGSSAVSLSIRPIMASVIGDAVYFVRETPADNSRLVLAEGIWTLSLGAVGDRGHDPAARGPTIVQHLFLFKEPRRWVGAADNPDLLLAIVPGDLQALPGCDLVWHRTPKGFETGGAPPACHPGSRAQGLWIEQHARLEGMQLSLAERQAGSDGALDGSGPPLSLQLTRTEGAQ